MIRRQHVPARKTSSNSIRSALPTLAKLLEAVGARLLFEKLGLSPPNIP